MMAVGGSESDAAAVNDGFYVQQILALSEELEELRRSRGSAEAQNLELSEQIAALKEQQQQQHETDMADIKGQAQSAALQVASQVASLRASFEEDIQAYEKKLESYVELVKRQELEIVRLRARHSSEVSCAGPARAGRAKHHAGVATACVASVRSLFCPRIARGPKRVCYPNAPGEIDILIRTAVRCVGRRSGLRPCCPRPCRARARGTIPAKQ
jgi:hypothetical protein